MGLRRQTDQMDVMTQVRWIYIGLSAACGAVLSTFETMRAFAGSLGTSDFAPAGVGLSALYGLMAGGFAGVVLYLVRSALPRRWTSFAAVLSLTVVSAVIVGLVAYLILATIPFALIPRPDGVRLGVAAIVFSIVGVAIACLTRNVDRDRVQ